MTISWDDLVSLPYSPEAPLAGYLYGCQRLFHVNDYSHASLKPNFQAVVNQAVVELALLRYLTEQKIPFSQEVDAPFTEPNHASLILGGHLCRIFTASSNPFLQADIPQVLERIRLNFPRDESLPDAHEDEELLFFAVLIPPNPIQTRTPFKDYPAGLWVHFLPKEWGQPHPWVTPGKLIIQSFFPGLLELLLDGQNSQHQYQAETIELKPKETFIAKLPFYALVALRSAIHPEGKVEIQGESNKPFIRIYPDQWFSLWTPGTSIRLLGYLSRGESRSMARTNPLKSYFSPNKLHPLLDFFEKVKLRSSKPYP